MTISGIALLLDSEGRLVEVMSDEAQLVPPGSAGSAFSALLDTGSQEKAQHFLDTVHAAGIAVDWEMTVARDRRLITLHFSGGLAGERVVVLAADAPVDAQWLAGALPGIDDGPSDAVRAMARDLAGRRPAAPKRFDEFDELTRLNNEMATLQREIVRKNIELTRLSEEKSVLLGMAAHDLRTPLSIIVAYSEVIAMEADATLSQDHKEMLDIIRDTARGLSTTVDDVLDFSQIESGRLSLCLEPVDPATVIEASLRLNGVIAQRKGIRLETAIAPGLPLVDLDRARIHQVLTNLLSNAIKFSHPGTTVTLSASASEETVRLAVADQGQGIPAEDVPKLFRPFGRTRVRTTAGEPSTGLGLAIVQRMVTGMGGRISVESEVGRGTRFTLELPRASASGPSGTGKIA